MKKLDLDEARKEAYKEALKEFAALSESKLIDDLTARSLLAQRERDDWQRRAEELERRIQDEIDRFHYDDDDPRCSTIERFRAALAQETSGHDADCAMAVNMRHGCTCGAEDDAQETSGGG